MQPGEPLLDSVGRDEGEIVLPSFDDVHEEKWKEEFCP